MVNNEKKAEYSTIKNKERLYELIISISVLLLTVFNYLGDTLSFFSSNMPVGNITKSTIHFDMLSVILLVCFIITIVSAFSRRKYKSAGLFISKLAPIICLIKLITDCMYVYSDSNSTNQTLNPDIKFSALGWIQFILAVFVFGVSIFFSVRKKEKNQ